MPTASPCQKPSMVPERMRGPYSGLSWEQDAAVASSSMGGCSTDHVALAENGATTRFPGPHPTNTPDPNVGGCLETWVSGPSMAADHARVTGEIEIAARASAGNGAAMATLSRHAARLARGLAHVVNIIDPDVLVLGGGLSQLSHLYEQLPPL